MASFTTQGSRRTLDHIVTPNLADYYSSWAARVLSVTLGPGKAEGVKVREERPGEQVTVSQSM